MSKTRVLLVTPSTKVSVGTEVCLSPTRWTDSSVSTFHQVDPGVVTGCGGEVVPRTDPFGKVLQVRQLSKT